MVSRREASSPSWRAMSLQFDRARSIAGWLTRGGRELDAERLTATIERALDEAVAPHRDEWRAARMQARVAARNSGRGRA